MSASFPAFMVIMSGIVLLINELLRMIRRALIITSCCISLTKLHGQVMGEAPGKGISMQNSPRGFVTQLPMAPVETTGDVYLNSDWVLADISLFNHDSELKDYPIKVNLQTNDVEISYQNQVKILSGRRVSSFVLRKNDGQTEKYVNGKNYKLNAIPIQGFLKVIDTGKWELLVRPAVTLVKSNYNQALAVGDRSDKFVKDEIPFFARDHSLYETRLSQQKFVKRFVGKEAEVKAFIKQQDISLKKINDLIELLHFLNENI